MYNTATEKQNDFLHVNLLSNPPKFYKKFELLNFNGNSDESETESEE
jgi:hypothetical protein